MRGEAEKQRYKLDRIGLHWIALGIFKSEDRALKQRAQGLQGSQRNWEPGIDNLQLRAPQPRASTRPKASCLRCTACGERIRADEEHGTRREQGNKVGQSETLSTMMTKECFTTKSWSRGLGRLGRTRRGTHVGQIELLVGRVGAVVGAAHG